MKYQILFSGKNNKNLIKLNLPIAWLSVNIMSTVVGHLVLSPREGTEVLVEERKEKERWMKEKANYSAETGEILKCVLPPSAASKAGPYHHLLLDTHLKYLLIWKCRSRALVRLHGCDMSPLKQKFAFGSSVDSEGQDQTAQSNQGLHCQLIELLDTTVCMNGEQRPG